MNPAASPSEGLTPTPASRQGHIRGLLTGTGYALAAACVYAAWALREQNLIHAGDGAGYWLGVAGASLMGLLLLYPLRKRVRALRRLGPVSVWFRVHMLLGIVGPLLIVLHSNFRLGSFNGRVALFATLVVAGSGIVGRYIYAKLHHGLYGRRATLEELRRRVEAMRERGAGAADLLGGADAALSDYEARLLSENPGLLGAFGRALSVAPRTALLRWGVARRARRRLDGMARQSPVIAQHRRRLLAGNRRQVRQRIDALRKFAQFRAFQRLFALWHVVHYPLFVILVFAVLVHVIAVHMY